MAGLVVVLAAPSPWVRWEMDTLRRLGLGDKTLLLLPTADPTRRQAGWDAALQCLVSDDTIGPGPALLSEPGASASTSSSRSSKSSSPSVCLRST